MMEVATASCEEGVGLGHGQEVAFFISNSYLKDKLNLPRGQRLGVQWQPSPDEEEEDEEMWVDQWEEEEEGSESESGDVTPEEDDEELQALAAMGLPTSFGGRPSGAGRRKKKGRKGQQQPHEDAPAAAAEGGGNELDVEVEVQADAGDQVEGEGEGADGGEPMDTDWEQAWDHEHGVHYYFNERLQQTQWEAPACGFVPMPWEWGHTEDDLARLTLADGEMGAEGGGAGGRDTVGAAVGHPDPSPPSPPPDGGHPERTHIRFRDSDGDEPAGAGGGRGEAAASGVVAEGDGGPGGGSRRSMSQAEKAMEAGGVVAEGDGGAGGGSRRSMSQAEKAMEAAQCPHPKYWYQRFRLFARFAEGVKMDEEGWYSVTPEAIARHHASRCAARGGVAVDAFCGVGGNAIQLAMTCGHVLAVDMDQDRLELARHNARCYGVESRISFVCADFLQIAPYLKADVVFLSPPWGGMSYGEAAEFDVRTMMGGLDGEAVLEAARGISPRVAYYLPRNCRPEQLGEMARGGERCEVEYNHLNKKIKAITAYYGGLARPPPPQEEGGEGP